MIEEDSWTFGSCYIDEKNRLQTFLRVTFFLDSFFSPVLKKPSLLPCFFGYQDEYPKRSDFSRNHGKAPTLQNFKHWLSWFGSDWPLGNQAGWLVVVGVGLVQHYFWENFLEIIHSEELEGWRKTNKWRKDLRRNMNLLERLAMLRCWFSFHPRVGCQVYDLGETRRFAQPTTILALQHSLVCGQQQQPCLWWGDQVPWCEDHGEGVGETGIGGIGKIHAEAASLWVKKKYGGFMIVFLET